MDPIIGSFQVSYTCKNYNSLGKVQKSPESKMCNSNMCIIAFKVLGARPNHRQVFKEQLQPPPAGDHDRTMTDLSAGDTLDKSRRHDANQSLLL